MDKDVCVCLCMHVCMLYVCMYVCCMYVCMLYVCMYVCCMYLWSGAKITIGIGISLQASQVSVDDLADFTASLFISRLRCGSFWGGSSMNWAIRQQYT